MTLRRGRFIKGEQGQWLAPPSRSFDSIQNTLCCREATPARTFPDDWSTRTIDDKTSSTLQPDVFIPSCSCFVLFRYFFVTSFNFFVFVLFSGQFQAPSHMPLALVFLIKIQKKEYYSPVSNCTPWMHIQPCCKKLCQPFLYITHLYRQLEPSSHCNAALVVTTGSESWVYFCISLIIWSMFCFLGKDDILIRR